MKPILLLLATACLWPAAVIAQDSTSGERAFRVCSACHSVGEGAVNRMGPQLNGVVGHPAGSQPGFSFSRSMVTKGEEGLVWTPETLETFLRKPREMVPGTKMSFAGLSDEMRLQDIIAYLLTFSPDYVPEAEAAAPAMGSTETASPTPAPAQ